MDGVEQLLREWVDDGLLPGAALRVVRDHRIWYSCDVGATSREKEQPVTPDTLFDLASLTKVTATLPAVLLLAQDGAIALEDEIGHYFSDCPADKKRITVAQLLAHTSGMPADLAVRRRDSEIVLPALLYEQELTHEPGTRVVYSDLGMIWLGLLIEQVSGERLDQFVARRIFTRLGMQHTSFLPSKNLCLNISSTEYCTLRNDYITGEVHDEKAFAMGGIAGHAGLFSTADDLCLYAMSWLYKDSRLLNLGWYEKAIRNHTEQAGGSRGYGWELNQASTTLSCGSGFHPASYGHTGFTGTSMWIDPVREFAIIFLTNAVHLGRNHQLRRLRPILHDAVTARLLQT